MTNTMEEKIVKLKLVIDNKEAEAVINLTKKQISELFKNSEAFTSSTLKWRLNITDFTKALSNEFQDYVNAIDRTISAVQNGFSKVYSVIQSNAKLEISEWKKKEESKLAIEHKAALNHAKTSKQKQKVDEEYEKKKEELDTQAKQKEYERLSVWFVFQKSLAAAQIAVQMAQAIAKGYGELGPIGGAIAMGVTIAALTAQAVAAASQKMPGYNLGGKLIPGKPGIFEANQVEIVAPEKTFLDVMQNEYMPQLLKSAAITMSLMNAKQNIGRPLNHTIGDLRNGDYGKLESTINKLNKKLDEGIDARAYLDDKQAKRIYNRGSALNRRNKF